MMTNTTTAPRVRVGDTVTMRCYGSTPWVVVRITSGQRTKMVELQESASRVDTKAGEINWMFPIACLVPSLFWKNVAAINGTAFVHPTAA